MENKTDHNSFANVTLDQWAMFVAVCDLGSAHEAGRHLGRSHSAVSHALKLLQEALGVTLMVVERRRLTPTVAGRVIAHRARRLLEQAKAVEDSAQAHAIGWEVELHIAVDGIVPRTWLANALAAFEPQSHGTRVTISHVLQTGALAAAQDPRYDLVLTAQLPDGVNPDPIGMIRFAPVVAATHPLVGKALHERSLDGELQIVLADSAPVVQEKGWLRAARRWTVPDVCTACALLETGLAFAILPIDEIQTALAQNRLQRLTPPTRDLTLQLHMVAPSSARMGPAAKVLQKALRACATPL